MESETSNGRKYVVSCSLKKAVPNQKQLDTLREASVRVHRCTFAATELLNLYVRDRIENHDATGLEDVFKQNWLLNAYNAVSKGKGSAKVVSAVQTVFDTHMNADEDFEFTDRKGLTQALVYECINLAAVGSTNVWMHFRKRVLAYTRTVWAMDEDAYKKLSMAERRARKLALMQAADDICRPPTEAKRSPEDYHVWVYETRSLLGIDTAVGD